MYSISYVCDDAFDWNNLLIRWVFKKSAKKSRRNGNIWATTLCMSRLTTFDLMVVQKNLNFNLIELVLIEICNYEYWILIGKIRWSSTGVLLLLFWTSLNLEAVKSTCLEFVKLTKTSRCQSKSSSLPSTAFQKLFGARLWLRIMIVPLFFYGLVRNKVLILNW